LGSVEEEAAKDALDYQIRPRWRQPVFDRIFEYPLGWRGLCNSGNEVTTSENEIFKIGRVSVGSTFRNNSWGKGSRRPQMCTLKEESSGAHLSIKGSKLHSLDLIVSLFISCFSLPCEEMEQ
jgi:hypothetical protein